MHVGCPGRKRHILLPHVSIPLDGSSLTLRFTSVEEHAVHDLACQNGELRLLGSVEELERVVEAGGHVALVSNDVVFGVHIDRPGPIFGGADRKQ